MLGTFQYMSPEQIEGGEADARSDIFAFGAVLYEMATGRKAFTGKSQASLIGSILRDEPAPISEVAPMTPPAFDARRQDLPRQGPRGPVPDRARRQAAAPVDRGRRLAGGTARLRSSRAARTARSWPGPSPPSLSPLRPSWPWGSFAARPRRPRSVRFEIATPSEVVSIDTPRISPDGQYLAFNATDSSGKTRIWIRALNAFSAQPLAGTRRDHAAFLVARQPVPGFLRRRKAQEDRGFRRAGPEDLRRPDGRGRLLEPGGSDPLRRDQHRSDLSRVRRGRSPGRRGQAR